MLRASYRGRRQARGSVAPTDVAAQDRGYARRDSSPARDYYVVRAGDTLAAIAARYGIDGGWGALYEANRQLLDGPDLILPGQRLHLP